MARLNNVYYVSDAVQSVPLNTTGTGTIETSGVNIIGTGTSFLTELAPGAWIVDLSGNECRRVRSVYSDTLAYLETGFSSDISASTDLDYIKAIDSRPFEISVLIPFVNESGVSNTAGTVDGAYLPVGASRTISRSTRERSSRSDLIDPFVIDATGTQMMISIVY